MTDLKAEVRREAAALGAQLVGFTHADRYREHCAGQEFIFPPTAIWPEARSVIVLGVPMPLPIIESTPSINYKELYVTSNILLDQMAYRLGMWLTARGMPAIWAPRDGYDSLEALLERPLSSFSHVIAGWLAGLGTLGWNHTLLTPQYGPRVRLVSVLTSAEIEPDPMQERELCLHCGVCRRLCPAGALTGDDAARFAEMDMDACTRQHIAMREAGCGVCGICTKVCPVGEDRQGFHRPGVKRYLEEAEGNLERPEVRAWQHIREFGAKKKKENLP